MNTESSSERESQEWFVMRDLTRPNAKRHAWQTLAELGFRVYTPMTWKVVREGKRNVRRQCPVIHDLLFVESTRQTLDPVVAQISNLQYRYKRGGHFQESMTVDRVSMERFIAATATDPNPRYYTPDELTPSMVGREVRIVGGPLNGMTGHLLSMRGTRKRRLIVDLPGTLTAAVEVEPEYIQFVNDNNK